MASEKPPRRDCTYCPEPDADVCVRLVATNSGPGHSIHAHRACAEERGVPVLFEYTDAPTGGAR